MCLPQPASAPLLLRSRSILQAFKQLTRSKSVAIRIVAIVALHWSAQLWTEGHVLLQAQAEVADLDAQAPAVVGRSVSVARRSHVLHGHDCPAGWAVQQRPLYRRAVGELNRSTML